MYFTSMFSLPKIHNLSLYMRKRQTNSNRETTYVTTEPLVHKTVKVNKKQGKSKKVSQL